MSRNVSGTPLEDSLRQAAAVLGRHGSVESLADFLLAAGCTGRRDSLRESPLSLWLSRQPGMGGCFIDVAVGIATARQGGQDVIVLLPRVAHQLELRFDAGKLPALDMDPIRKPKLEGYDRPSPNVLVLKKPEPAGPGAEVLARRAQDKEEQVAWRPTAGKGGG